MTNPKAGYATPRERAFWTFLAATLIGPFFASLIVMALNIGAGLAGMGPPSVKGLTLAKLLELGAVRAVETYVWSAIPAAIAGAVAAAFVALRGDLPWLAAACIGGLTGGTAAFLAGGIAAQHLTPITFIGATAAVLCWLALRRVGMYGHR